MIEICKVIGKTKAIQGCVKTSTGLDFKGA